MEVSAVTTKFEHALAYAETKAISDLDDKWCVCLRYGCYGAFTYEFAKDRDYHIICVTVL